MPSTEIELLKNLAMREIEYIRSLTQPVVRVCGPLTCDGPSGYARNAARLAAAEKFLAAQGASVWSFVDSEKEIAGKGFEHKNVVTYFHEPILRSGLIAAAYFLPRWEESGGATQEQVLCAKAGVEIREFPEAWLQCCGVSAHLNT